MKSFILLDDTDRIHNPNKCVWVAVKLEHKCRAVSWCFSKKEKKKQQHTFTLNTPNSSTPQYNTFYTHLVIIQIKQKWNNMSKPQRALWARSCVCARARSRSLTHAHTHTHTNIHTAQRKSTVWLLLLPLQL